MCKTLNLLDGILSKARRLQEMGRSHDALPILCRLSKYPELPPAVAAEVRQAMGEAYLDVGQFRAARKCLRVALRLEPANATVHHLLARAIESDPQCDSRLAGRHHRRALELAPHDADFLAIGGSYFVEMGRVRRGLELLRRAVELAPDDFEILDSLVEALCDVNRFDEARKTLNAARFQFSGNMRLPNLVAGVELREIRERQAAARHSSPDTRITEPIVFQFPGVTPSSNRPVRALRRDAGRTRVSRPHLLRRFDAGQAQ